jgi:type IV secretory pathway TraG/TraD family ATPase VirD4
MTAGEIMQMRDEVIIVFHRRLPPMRLKRMDWRRYSLLADRRPLLTPIKPASRA